VTLATVPSSFANALALEGTGKLLDDRILNIAGCGCGGGFNCFAELDPIQFPWGQGSQGNALDPFHSIATDTSVLAFGTKVYAPALAGVVVPGGEVHDGCLVAADVGGGINGMHIDWFVGLKANYQTLDPDVPETLELFEGGTQCP
jgi:3D (Asp-Asp-Asp) domain-containing protein